MIHLFLFISIAYIYSCIGITMLRSNTFFYLNGPPSVGKDEIGAQLASTLNSQVFTFKRQLIKIAKTIAQVSDSRWEQLYLAKENPSKRLFGMSPRQFLIQVSETMVKPSLGADYFGEAARKHVLSVGSKIYRPFHPVFTDSGFEPEVGHVIRAFPAARHVVVQLYCEGKTFKNDSRGYLDLDVEKYPEVMTLKLDNPRVEDELLPSHIKHIVSSILKPTLVGDLR